MSTNRRLGDEWRIVLALARALVTLPQLAIFAVLHPRSNAIIDGWRVRSA